MVTFPYISEKFSSGIINPKQTNKISKNTHEEPGKNKFY